MYPFISLILKFIIAFTIINVWLFRKNKKTLYRGGNANSLKEEFLIYNLPEWSFYFIGTVKIITSILIFLSFWIRDLEFFSLSSLTIIMLGSLIMHIKVNDPFKKSIPAIIILVFLIIDFTIF